MAVSEVRSIYDPIQSQIFSVELAHLLACLEGRPVGLVVERALRAYGNASPSRTTSTIRPSAPDDAS